MEVNKIYCGDSLAVLKTFPDNSINCCVSSPPYWGLRDYGVNGQLGLEPTLEEYVTKLVEVFREVRRALRNDGTLWLNIGDSYAGCSIPGGGDPTIGRRKFGQKTYNKKTVPAGLKPKDMVGIPWMVAFALRSDGWYLRSDIIWHKPNPMPESVKDRPTKAHEYLFLLSKSQKYYYDAESIKEPAVYSGTNNGVGFGHGTDKENRNRSRINIPSGWDTGKGSHGSFHGNGRAKPDKCCSFKRKVKESPPPGQPNNHREDRQDISYSGTRNKRTVWTVPTHPFPEAHFATFPPKLIEPCILAGCPEGGIVLDPFMGSGTTAMVSAELSRNYIGIELNPNYIKIAEKRLSAVQVRLNMS